MNTSLAPFSRMRESLHACERGELSATALSAQWRAEATQCPLPERLQDILGQLLDRLEASALFSEESCSFSQKDLLASLRLWLDKASVSIKS